MTTTIKFADSPLPVMMFTMPSVAPENERIWENVVAPTMMNKIIAEIRTVPCRESINILTVRAL